MKNKKVVTVLIIAVMLVLCFSLSACGGKAGKGDGNGDGNQGATENSIEGKYYEYTNGEKEEDAYWFEIKSGNQWVDDENYSGRYTLNGEKLTLYCVVEGNEEEWLEATKTSDYVFKNFDDDGTITSYRKSDPPSFTVTFSTGDDSVVVENKVVKEDAEFELPANPKREGYNFLGWFNDEDYSVRNNGGAVTKDTTLFAKWEMTYAFKNFHIVDNTLLALKEPAYALDELRLPNTVNTIDTKAFKKTYADGTVSERDTAYAGKLIFTDCYNLTTVNDDAFNGLTTPVLRVPSTITTFTGTPFKNCQSTLIYLSSAITSRDGFSLSMLKLSEESPVTYVFGATSKGSEWGDFGEYTVLQEKCIFDVSSSEIIENEDYVLLKRSAFLSSDYYLVKYFIDTETIDLTELSEAYNLIGIFDYALANKTVMQNVILPAGISELTAQVFINNAQLTNISVAEGSPLTIVGGKLVLDGSTVIVGAKGAVLPNDGSVTKIGDYAFAGRDITALDVPASVTEIGNGAFEGSGLTGFTLPGTVTTLGNDIFKNCVSLADTTLTVPGNTDLNRLFGYTDNYDDFTLPIKTLTMTGTNLNYSISRHCLDLENFYFGGLVEEIPSGFFEGLLKLTGITIPDSVTSIGNYAFRDCTGLTSITIPDSVTSIGSDAFKDCASLSSVTIGEGVTSIGRYAFEICYGIKDVYITDLAKWCGISFERIESNPLSYAQNLYINGVLATDIEIPDGVISISADAFNGYSKLTKITIPSSMTNIGDNAFSYCTRLIEVYNKSALTITAGSETNGKVGYYAKNVYTEEGGSKLTTDANGYMIYTEGAKKILVAYNGADTILTLPNGITEIFEYAFFNHLEYTSITISDSVTDIDDNAFSGCASLTSVTIGRGVTSIGNSAFSNCPQLASITVTSGNPKYHSAGNCLIETSSKTLIAGCKTSVIPTNGSVTSIGNYAFSGCIELISITIPSSVTSIAGEAFIYCNKLIEVYNKSSLDISPGHVNNGYIGLYARNVYTSEGGSKLSTDANGYVIYTDGAQKVLVTYTGDETELTLPNGITQIYFSAFSNNCDKIISVTIPNSVERIFMSAFGGCTGLTSITIPDSVTRVDMGAFMLCTRLAEINCRAASRPSGWNTFWNSECNATVTWGYTGD